MTTRPTSLADVAAILVARPDMPVHKPLSEFLDEFYEAERGRVAMLGQEPSAAIPAEIAAYLAATAEYLSTMYALTPPEWVFKERYFLDRAFYPRSVGPASEAIMAAESPTSFRRRLVFVEGKPLRRKLGPIYMAR